MGISGRLVNKKHLLSRLETFKARGVMDEMYRATSFRNRAVIRDLVQTLEKKGYEPGTRASDRHEAVRLAGRVASVRKAGKNLVFMDVEGKAEGLSGSERIQVVCNRSSMEQFETAQSIVLGDHIGIEGLPGKTKRGEISVYPSNVQLLAPCLHDIPEKLDHVDLRNEYRYVDLIVNDEARHKLALRSRVLRKLRDVLHDRGFHEVDTPILWSQSGGAVANPFETHSNALDKTLQMRIAPELFLKKLVVAGMDKVFEIGKVFRNEGIDATHNPEFTICEVYQAYADYEDMMTFTEQLCRDVEQHALGEAASLFIEPFDRVDILPTLKIELEERGLDSKVVDSDRVNLDETFSDLLSVCTVLGYEAPKQTEAGETKNGKLVDFLIGELIEPQCIRPTFLLHHPVCLSPLAKEHHATPGVTERFELIVGGKELCNAYSELNDPFEQRRRMTKDGQITPADDSFCTALEYGLPPTAGWGMGVDRFCMMLANTGHIRDVTTFPLVH